jgi:molybdopterin molybdotransferase
MLTIEQAIEQLDANSAALGSEVRHLRASAGLRLAADVPALFDLPPADVSMMDGYAVCSADSGKEPLKLALETPAGSTDLEIQPGTCARIQTGAEVPRGADAVVPKELATVRPDGSVTVPRTAPGHSIRTKGEVCRVGQILAQAGDLLTPQRMGLLASAGPSTVQVTPKPLLAVVTTGSELVSSDDRPGHGKIRDSNAAMMEALAREAHLPVAMYERVPDSRPAIRELLLDLTKPDSPPRKAGAKADLVITSGGVSVGDYDFVRAVVEELGGKILFHRIAVRPGKPTLAARLGRSWLIGLPGNPLSALVVWHLLARPLAHKLAGNATAFKVHSGRALCRQPASNPGDRVTFAPARVAEADGRAEIELIPWKGSHDLLALGQANALAILPMGAKIESGGVLEFIRI